jgi:glycosyltransferase involved in cell wall biosynthesis
MRIGIEAQRLFRPKKHGMDIVALELIKAIQRMDTEHEFFVFVKPDEDDKILHDTDNVKIIQLKGFTYPLWEQIVLPFAVKKYNLDVLHCTANTAPINCPVPLIVTLHDIIFLEKLHFLQGTMYQRFGNLYRRWNVPRLLDLCETIVTVSDFERARIQHHFHLAKEKVVAVHNAVGAHFRRISDVGELAIAKEKYNLPDRFIFFLGNTDPKKNVRGVVSALGELKKNGKLNIPLVMPDLDKEYLLRIMREVGASELREDILLCGYIPNAELPAILNQATLFLYPSLRESFGIPLLEAMACGVPVITSNTASMPEVAADAAAFVDPFNPHTIAQKIDELLNDEEQCRELALKGLERAEDFSWDITAQKMIKIYENTKKN